MKCCAVWQPSYYNEVSGVGQFEVHKFWNAFFLILRNSLVMVFIYRRYKSVVT